MSFSSELSTDFCNGLNTKHFIREVQMRPAIWDTSCDDYNDRNKRKQCWEELTYLFLAKSDVATPVSEAEREIFTRLLQKKWKNVRDCYTRELLRSRKMKSGVVVPRKNAYLYFKQLTFLRDVVRPSRRKDLAKSLEDDSQTTVVKKEPHSTSISYESPYHETSNHSSRDPLEALIVKEPEIHPEDCDRLFLLSLVKPLKTIPEDKRFDVKMEMMQVIQNAQQSLRNNVMMMKFEGETSVNFDDDKSLDSIREPPTPVLSENNDSNDIENM